MTTANDLKLVIQFATRLNMDENIPEAVRQIISAQCERFSDEVLKRDETWVAFASGNGACQTRKFEK